MLYMFTRGGAAVFLLTFVYLLMFIIVPAQAREQEPQAGPETSYVRYRFAEMDLSDTIVCATAIAIVAFTGVGVRAARGSTPWPHWRRLVRGLGEAAFLVALVDAFCGLGVALETLAAMGAAVTPADVASGLSRVLWGLGLGAGAALLGLGATGLLRLLEAPRA